MPVQPIIPTEWPLVYTLVVGQDWPQADEDALRRCAQAWTDALSSLVDISGQGSRAGQNVHYSVQSISSDEFDTYWKQYTTGDDSAVGQLAQQCEMLAQELLSFAEQTEFTKISIDIQIIVLMIQVLFDLVISPLTGGLSMGEALASMFFTRTVVREILSKLIEAVIMAVLPDLITQGIMKAEGHRSQIDWGEVGQQAQMGLIGAVAGMGVGRALGGFGEGLENRLGKKIGGLVNASLTGAVNNVVTNTAVSAVDAGEQSLFGGQQGDDGRPDNEDQKGGGNTLNAIINGAFTGAMFHGIHEVSAKPTVHFSTDQGNFKGVKTGDGTFTLFPEDKKLPTGEANHDFGKMQLATLDDNGVLKINKMSPGGGSYEATPTAMTETSHGTTTHSTFDNGTQVTNKVEQVSNGGETFTYTKDAASWTAPKNSVVTHNAIQDTYQVNHTDGQKQLVYASGSDKNFSYVGHTESAPGGTRYFDANGDPTSRTGFNAALAGAQQPAPVVHTVAQPPAQPVTVHPEGGSVTSVPGPSVTQALPETSGQSTGVLAAAEPVDAPTGPVPAESSIAQALAPPSTAAPSTTDRPGAPVAAPAAPRPEEPVGGAGTSGTGSRGDTTVRRGTGRVRPESESTRSESPGRRAGLAEEEAPIEPAATGPGEENEFVPLGGESDDAASAGGRPAKESAAEEPEPKSTVERPEAERSAVEESTGATPAHGTGPRREEETSSAPPQAPEPGSGSAAFDNVSFAKRYGLAPERFGEVMAHDIKLDYGSGPATPEEKAGVIASVHAQHGEEGLRLLEAGASYQEINVLAHAAEDGHVPLARLTHLMNQDLVLEGVKGEPSRLEEKFHAIAEVAAKHGRGGLALLEAGARHSDIDTVAANMTRHDMERAASELRAQTRNEHPLPPEVASEALKAEAKLRQALRDMAGRLSRKYRAEFGDLGVINSVAELWNSGKLVDKNGDASTGAWVSGILLKNKVSSELGEGKFGVLAQIHDALKYVREGHRVEIESDADIIVRRGPGESDIAIQLKALKTGKEPDKAVGNDFSEDLKEAMRQLQGWGGKAHNNPEKARPGMLAVAEVRIMNDNNQMYSMTRDQVLGNLRKWFEPSDAPRREDIEVRHPDQPTEPMELRVRNGNDETFVFTRDDFAPREAGDEIWYKKDLPSNASPSAPQSGEVSPPGDDASLSSVDFDKLGLENSQRAGYWTEPEQAPPWTLDPTDEERSAVQGDLNEKEGDFLNGLADDRRNLFEKIQDEIVRRDAKVRPELEGTLGDKAGGKIVGDENFRKRSPSIDEKIRKLEPEQRDRAFALADEPDRLLTEFSGDLNDLQRYTVTYPKEGYVEGTLAQLRALQQADFRLFDGPGRPVRDLSTPGGTLAEGKYVKNFWREGNRYEGLNLTLVGPDGEVFELQFHTPESFRLKQNLTEVMYKVASAGDHVSPLRKVNALQELVAVNREYLEPLPEGIEKLGPAKNATFDKLAGEVYDRATPEHRAVLDTMLSQLHERGPDVPLGGAGGHPLPRGHLHELTAESTPDHRVLQMLPEDGQGPPVKVHLERTRSGWSMHVEGESGAELNRRAAAMAKETGFVNVVAHATPDGFLVGGHVVAFREVFDRVGLPREGDVVRLIACEAGGGEAAARLAQEIDRPVVAADKPVWLTKDGKVVSASAVDPVHDPYPKRPPDGDWKMFLPDGTVRTLEPDEPQRPEAPRGWERDRGDAVAPRRRNAVLDALTADAKPDLVELGDRKGLTTQPERIPGAKLDKKTVDEVTDVLAGRYTVNRGVSIATLDFLGTVPTENIGVYRVFDLGTSPERPRPQWPIFEEVVAKWLNNQLPPEARMGSGKSEYTTLGGYLVKETFETNRSGLQKKYESEAQKIAGPPRAQGESAKAYLIRTGNQDKVYELIENHRKLDPSLRFSQTEIPGLGAGSYGDIVGNIRKWQWPDEPDLVTGVGGRPAFTDRELAYAMRDLLRLDPPEQKRAALERLAVRVDPTYPGFDGARADGTAAADTDGGRFASQVAAITELVYALEPARHPEALFCNLMALHLAAEGQIGVPDAIAYFNTMHAIGAAQLSDKINEHTSRSLRPENASDDDRMLDGLMVDSKERTSTFRRGRLAEEVAEFRRRERDIIARFGLYHEYFADGPTAAAFFGLRTIHPGEATPGVNLPFPLDLVQTSAGDEFAFAQSRPDPRSLDKRTQVLTDNLGGMFRQVAGIFGWQLPSETDDNA